MIMSGFIKRLRADNLGSTMVEFALVAPALMAFIFLILEGGRMIWTKQLLEDAALDSARCLGLRALPCKTDAGVQAFAVEQATSSGVRLLTANVTVQANVACNGTNGLGRVRLEVPYSSPAAGFLPVKIDKLSAEACFPMVM